MSCTMIVRKVSTAVHIWSTKESDLACCEATNSPYELRERQQARSTILQQFRMFMYAFQWEYSCIRLDNFVPYIYDNTCGMREGARKLPVATLKTMHTYPAFALLHNYQRRYNEYDHKMTSEFNRDSYSKLITLFNAMFFKSVYELLSIINRASSTWGTCRLNQTF